MNANRTSNVEVIPLDFTCLKEKAIAKLQEKHQDRKVVGVTFGLPAGTIHTKQGIYALNHEGVGSNEPISKANPFIMEFYGVFDAGNGKESYELMPSLTMKFDDIHLTEFESGQKVNLADFIRRFGSRLEDNFNEWNIAMSNII